MHSKKQKANKKEMKIITKINTYGHFNAGSKAVNDISQMTKLQNLYLKSPLETHKTIFAKLVRHWSLYFQIKKIHNDDLYLIQYPLYINSFLSKYLYNKNIDIVFLIHDLQGLRSSDLMRNKNEIEILKQGKSIISHNQVMTDYLISQGIDKNKIVNLELFDYLCDEVEYKNKDLKDGLTIAYAGNIDKAPFIKQLDSSKMNFDINLYGVKSDNLMLSDKTHYIGKETPERLPNLIDAHLGLVWDGNIDSSDENDLLKNYTKYNNPHKASCYLAAGIPVVVWSKSAIWNFVKENDCGYCIDSIYDINNLDLSDYEEKRKNAIEISKKVRSGYYTKKAFNAVFENLGLEERLK